MKTPAHRISENNYHSEPQRASQLHSGKSSEIDLIDNRQETVRNRGLQEVMNNSPQVKQMQAIQKMADNNTGRQSHHFAQNPNNTGLPNQLKAGIENLSGMNMNHVKVHYNSAMPAQLNAHAYAQGSEIYLGSGQEKHLPHEAWHVVQQAQGRVKPTMQMKDSVAVNDDTALEAEADVMGAKALSANVAGSTLENCTANADPKSTIQRKKEKAPGNEWEYKDIISTLGYRVRQKVFDGIPKPEEVKEEQKGEVEMARALAIWKEANAVYENCETKGKGYYKQLGDEARSFTKFKGKEDGYNVDYINDKVKMRDSYDTRFKENYDSDIINHCGIYATSNGNKESIKDEEYLNGIDLSFGQIRAENNSGGDVDPYDWSRKTVDSGLKKGVGLNNSEILWQQYKMIAMEKHKGEDQKVNDEMKKLSSIMRVNILNNETKVTGYMAYPDGKKWDYGQTWTPADPEFFAFLGTPNAKSSAFILIDHMDELGKTIESITTTPNNMKINFKEIE